VKVQVLLMAATELYIPSPIIEGAELRRHTSFGAVYDGRIEHENSTGNYRRFNTCVEAVPNELAFPDSAVVVCGGYTSSREHYVDVQRQLGLCGERSILVNHEKHKGYEIGHNAEDIGFTCEALASGGVKKIILFGHSQGGPEALEAHELIRERGIDIQVTDIVLAFPAQFIDRFPVELVKSLPLFVVESLYGFIRNPMKQMRFTMQVMRNVATDAERTAKEGWHLISQNTGFELYDRAQSYEVRPKIHLVVGVHDGLVPGLAVLKGFKDKHHDTLTVLNTGHIEMNNAPAITSIIHKKVRQGGSLVAA
jgi:pimeloyl-ACP methyl ester carboxylesterase